MKIGIWGATGSVGRATVPELIARGHTVRVVGRKRTALEALYPGSMCEIVEAAIGEPAGAASAAEGLDAVVYTIGLPYTRAAFAQYPPMMDTALAALRGARVKRLLHISNVYPYGRPQANPVAEDHPLRPCSVKGEYRKQQEDRVRAAHDPGTLETIVLRPPDFYGPGTMSLTSSAFQATLTGKAAEMLAPVDRPHEFVFVRDLGETVARLIDRDGVWGKAYNVPSAGTITQREMAQKIFSAAGVTPRIRIAGPIVRRILGLFVPVLRELGEMMYLLDDPILLDGSRLKAALGDDLPITDYDEGIRRTLEAMKAEG